MAAYPQPTARLGVKSLWAAQWSLLVRVYEWHVLENHLALEHHR